MRLSSWWEETRPLMSFRRHIVFYIFQMRDGDEKLGATWALSGEHLRQLVGRKKMSAEVASETCGLKMLAELTSSTCVLRLEGSYKGRDL